MTERFNDIYKVWQPMKYATAKKEEILDAALGDPNYGLQLKVDGASYVWAKDLDGSVHLYGDKISKKTGEVIDKIDNTPHMKEWAEEYFPNGTQFVVELFSLWDWSGKEPELQEHSSSKYVNSIMLSKPEKAIERQLSTNFLGAYVFDCLYIDGKPIYEKDFADRYEDISQFFDNKSSSSWLNIAELITDEKLFNLSDWLKNGYEGGVLKLLHSTDKLSAAHHVSELGTTAKRPMHVTYKIKQMDTLDVACIGVTWPEKEYKGKEPETYPYRDKEGNPVNRLWALGMINAIEIGVWDPDKNDYVHIGTVASGLDDEMRLKGEELIGKVFEITCMSIDKKERTLRHPRLMRERPDKEGVDCLVSEIFG